MGFWLVHRAQWQRPGFLCDFPFHRLFTLYFLKRIEQKYCDTKYYYSEKFSGDTFLKYWWKINVRNMPQTNTWKFLLIRSQTQQKQSVLPNITPKNSWHLKIAHSEQWYSFCFEGKCDSYWVHIDSWAEAVYLCLIWEWVSLKKNMILIYQLTQQII